MSETSSSNSGGVGFIGALTILFIALKLLGAIHWRWLWVLSPLWIGTAVTLLVIAVVLFIGMKDKN